MRKLRVFMGRVGKSVWPTVDRLLLVSVLAVQLVMLSTMRELAQDRSDNVSMADKTSAAAELGPSGVLAGQMTDIAHVGVPTVGSPAVVVRRPVLTFGGNPALGRMRTMQSRMDRMREEAISDFERMSGFWDIDHRWESLLASPAIDMREEDGAYVVVCSLPGIEDENVRVTIRGRLLTIVSALPDSGSRGRRYVYERKVQLPGPVDEAGGAEAVMTNGVLRVVVPMAQQLEPDDAPARIL